MIDYKNNRDAGLAILVLATAVGMPDSALAQGSELDEIIV